MSDDGFPEGDNFEGIERISLLILTAVPPLMMIPFNIFILFMYAKYNKNLNDGMPLFKTTVVFILLTIGFYICYIIRGINFCYGNFKHEAFIVSASTPLYGGHFLFFIVCLFHRLYKIFKDSQYKLNKCTIKVFYACVIFGLTDAIVFVVFLIFDNEGIWWKIFHSLGMLTILFTYIWVSFLYIIKLFSVIRDTVKNMDAHSHEHSASSAFSAVSRARSKSNGTASAARSSRNGNKQILASITKYTLLTTISVVINFIYWGFTVRPKETYLHYIQTFSALFLWQLSITVNMAGFVLGFHFSQRLYTKICSRSDGACAACFEFMVYFTLERQEIKQRKKEETKTEKSTNVALEIGVTKSEQTIDIEYPEQSPPAPLSPPPQLPEMIQSNVTVIEAQLHDILQ